MPDFIAANEVATLIEEGYAADMLRFTAEGSTSIQAFGSVPVGKRITHLPVLATMPQASWVNGETGTKAKSTATWADSTMVIEELAVIIPVAEATIDDASEDLLDEVAKMGGQALSKELDLAVLFGIRKPVTWTSPALLPAAVAAGQAFTPAQAAGVNDLPGGIYQAAEAVDNAGFDPSSFVAPKGLRFRMANLRDDQGRPLLSTSLGAGAVNASDDVAGLPAKWAVGGSWDRGSALALVADQSRVRIGIRQDVTVKFLDQATITGADGEPINLAERDMVALRIKARFGYVLGRGATSEGPNKTPVAAVLPYAA